MTLSTCLADEQYGVSEHESLTSSDLRLAEVPGSVVKGLGHAGQVLRSENRGTIYEKWSKLVLRNTIDIAHAACGSYHSTALHVHSEGGHHGAHYLHLLVLQVLRSLLRSSLNMQRHQIRWYTPRLTHF